MLNLDRMGFNMCATVILDTLILRIVDIGIGMGLHPGTGNKLDYNESGHIFLRTGRSAHPKMHDDGITNCGIVEARQERCASVMAV